MDNFDLKKFLKENKAIENLNPLLAESYTEFKSADQKEKGVMTSNNEEEIYEADAEMSKDEILRGKIREYILAELGNNDLEEAKKKKKKDIEDVEVEVAPEDAPEDMPEDAPEDMPDMDAEVDTTDIEMGAGANLNGDEKGIMNNLMKALELAKQGGNEKVITQISNTLKFFISEYVAN
jgi:hypothetical protein